MDETTFRRPPPCALVIFGASGDLTRRKLLPALWNLAMENALPEGFSVVGVARTPKTTEEFREEARKAAEDQSRFRSLDSEKWRRFAEGIFYQRIEYDRTDTYRDLGRLLDRLCEARGSCGNHLFYLATPPSGYEEIVRQLGAAGLAGGAKGGWARVIVEKPFGRDLESARSLNATLKSVLQEHQIYRIDHYLGKETVQNLLVFRFANGMFEPLWNQRYVDHVQITSAESLGVEGRGAYYEEAGALRDMIQNHLMQVMCLVAMEPPARLSERAVRNEKQKVLEAVRPIPQDQVALWAARGQYAAGVMPEGPVRGYLEEEGVSPNSRTETYAAIKLEIENWRWAGVPFYIRTGKRLPQRVTEVSIHFKAAPHLLFREFPDLDLEQNVVTLRIQPNEGVRLGFGVKVPGAGMQVRTVKMRFCYQDEFAEEPPDAYERLLLDCMLGDITLFSRDDWMETSWQLLDPVLKAWYGSPDPLPQYPAGTWGPREAAELLARDGRAWRVPGS